MVILLETGEHEPTGYQANWLPNWTKIKGSRRSHVPDRFGLAAAVCVAGGPERGVAAQVLDLGGKPGVGDGGFRRLTGAASPGLSPVLLLAAFFV